jgi:hypothetical protein
MLRRDWSNRSRERAKIKQLHYSLWPVREVTNDDIKQGVSRGESTSFVREMRNNQRHGTPRLYLLRVQFISLFFFCLMEAGTLEAFGE